MCRVYTVHKHWQVHNYNVQGTGRYSTVYISTGRYTPIVYTDTSRYCTVYTGIGRYSAAQDSIMPLLKV